MHEDLPIRIAFALCLHVICVLLIGFDSDDEIDEHDRAFYERSRQVKGRQYRALPPEEPVRDGRGTMDICNHSNGGRLANYGLGQGHRRHSRSETSLSQGGMRPINPALSQGSLKMSSLNSDCVQKPVPNFSATVPNSRYQPVSTSQYSVSPPSQSATGQQQETSESHSTGSVATQQTGGSTCGQPTSSLSASCGRNLGSDVAEEGTSYDPESSRYADSERMASGETSSPPEDGHEDDDDDDDDDDEGHRRHRRYPSYEYHDDSGDDYYDEDGNPTAYIRDREHGGISDVPMLV